MHVEMHGEWHVPGKAQHTLGGEEAIAACELVAGGIEGETARVQQSPTPT
jgi:hypothetical protein